MTQPPQLTFDPSQRRARPVLRLSSYKTIQLSNYRPVGRRKVV